MFRLTQYCECHTNVLTQFDFFGEFITVKSSKTLSGDIDNCGTLHDSIILICQQVYAIGSSLLT